MTALQAYVVCTCVLVLNMLGLWVYSGAVRGKVKNTPNEEDVRAQGAQLSLEEPPEVRRVLRAHTNAMANIVPFLFVAYLYVSVASPKPLTATIVLGAFTLFRLGHSFVYLGGKQPWRSIFWALGLLTTLITVVLLLIGVFT